MKGEEKRKNYGFSMVFMAESGSLFSQKVAFSVCLTVFILICLFSFFGGLHKSYKYYCGLSFARAAAVG